MVTSDTMVVNDPDSDVWNNIQVSAYTATGAVAPSTCDTDFSTAGWIQIVANAPLGTTADTKQTLATAAGNVQHYCFILTMNANLTPGSVVTDINELQGRTIAPGWEFRAESV